MEQPDEGGEEVEEEEEEEETRDRPGDSGKHGRARSQTYEGTRLGEKTKRWLGCVVVEAL